MKAIAAASLLGLLALPASGGELKRNLADESTLATVASRFAVAWNRHDVDGLTAFFTPDATIINPAGRAAKGGAEIRKLFEDEQGGMMKDSTLETTFHSAQWIRQDVVLATWDATLKGARGADGKALPTSKLVVSWLAVKVKEGKEENWLCAAARPMLLPAAPPAAK